MNEAAASNRFYQLAHDAADANQNGTRGKLELIMQENEIYLRDDWPDALLISTELLEALKRAVARCEGRLLSFRLANGSAEYELINCTEFGVHTARLITAVIQRR